MDCKTGCFWGAFLGALIGAGLGFVIGAIIACLVGAGAVSIAAAPVTIATMGLGEIIAALIGCGIGTATGLGFAIFCALVGAILGFVISYATCAERCDSANVTTVSGQAEQGLTVPGYQDMTCKEARAARQRAEADLAHARREREAQEKSVNALRLVMQTARIFRNGALATIGAIAWWDLPGLVVAIVTAAAAAVVAAAAEAWFVSARRKLRELDAKVAMLEGILAMARAVEEALCGSDSGDTPTESPPSVVITPPGTSAPGASTTSRRTAGPM